MTRTRRASHLLAVLIAIVVITFLQTSVVSAQSTSQTFTGTWTATGTRETMSFGENRETALIKLAGHVNLENDLGKEKDYWSTCIGLIDTKTGSDVRCVWKGLKGTKIFVILQADEISQKSTVTGKVVGGSGPAKDIQGSLSFTWSSLTFQNINNIKEIGGFTTDIQGTYTLP